MLFATVPWSKFAHRFFKPTVAYQRRLEEGSGSSDLPSPQDRILTAEAVTRHTLFRQKTRWRGYYYRADHPKLDDDQWHVFMGAQYDAETGTWRMSKLPVHHII